MNQIIDPTKAVKAVPFLPILTAELLRDFFAGCALQGILTGDITNVATGEPIKTVEGYAYAAYHLADAMLKAREQK